MLAYILLAACLVSMGYSGLSEQELKQIEGLKQLLSNLDGAYATCQLVLFSEMVDFETADNRCKNFELGGKVKGNLATVNDEEKNAELKLLLAMAYPESSGRWEDDEWVWAGLRKVKNNGGSKKSEIYNPDDWEWADGSTPKSYHEWLPNQPDQRPGMVGDEIFLQNQMRINHDGKWDDTFANKTHPYACDYQGKYILSATHKAWSDAKQACDDAGLIMARVRNEQEREEMLAAMEYFLEPADMSGDLWIQDNWVWLGGNDVEEEGKWVWNDGEPFGEWFDTMPWAPRQPDNASFLGVTQDFLAISKWGTFDDSYDSPKRARPFACQCPNT